MNNTRNGSSGGSARRRRMSRRRRQQIIRRRKIALATVMAVFLLLLVTGSVLIIRAAAGSSREANQTGMGAPNTVQGDNGGSIGSNNADSSSMQAQTGKPADSGQVQTGQQSGDGQTQTGQQPDNVQTQPQDKPDNPSVPADADSTFTTSKGFKGYVKDGVTYIDGYVIVNKTYALPSDYIPQNPEVPVTSEWSTKSLDKELMQAYRQLEAAASQMNLNIYISSGYRSYNTQKNLYNNYVAKDGKVKADTYSARAGHSEHQTGICFDLNTIDDSFQFTDEGIWVNDNAYKYGFIIRYPKGKEHITGYQYESWHLRYVGKEMAEKLYNNGDWITMEEYFGIDSKYAE